MPTILIVDDLASDRDLAGGLPQKDDGLFIIYATNGVEALLQLATEMPDVILTDLEMPEMETQQIRRFPQFRCHQIAGSALPRRWSQLNSSRTEYERLVAAQQILRTLAPVIKKVLPWFHFYLFR